MRLLDPAWFVPRLTIVDREGVVRQMDTPTQEQWTVIEAWKRWRNICILKPRQIGSTTITQALAFHAGYTASDPIDILTLTHESGACSRVNMMLKEYARGLPDALRPRLSRANMSEIELAHNGVTFRQGMAGGRGQSRSFTNHIVIATEMAFWPQGSASVKGGTEADRDVWASTLATMHDGPYRRVVVESTGDGPTGQFYDIVKIARSSEDWAFIFFRWFDFQQYRRDPGPDWERTPEEAELARLHGLDDSQLAWRRNKLLDQGYSEMRFRREYPATWEEPFLLAESTWFDAELLNRVLARLPADRIQRPGALEVYAEAEPDRRYFIGMDTSGGTGRDYAVIQVLRDDMEQVCVWRSNTTPPHTQAETAANIAARYNGAVVLCEENNFGKQVIKRMERLGVRCWKDEKGKNFWTQGGRAGQTKKMIYGHGQRLVNQGHACSAAQSEPTRLNDPTTINELIVVREDEKGNIQAPEGSHDDHADALMLAYWCGRRFFSVATSRPADPNRAKLRAHRALRM